jgi:hypothetical protein
VPEKTPDLITQAVKILIDIVTHRLFSRLVAHRLVAHQKDKIKYFNQTLKSDQHWKTTKNI